MYLIGPNVEKSAVTFALQAPLTFSEPSILGE